MNTLEQGNKGLTLSISRFSNNRALPKLRDPPELADYYIPSEGQKDGEIAFIIGGMALVGIVAYKVF